MEEQMDKKRKPSQISRRTFLKAVASSAGLATVGVACSNTDAEQGMLPAPSETPMPVALQQSEVPFTPSEPPPADILTFFTLHEAQTVEAITARILPGSPDDPGAREAGVVNYIDKMLSYEQGFAQPIYRMPPYAETFEGDSPPQKEGTEKYTIIWVKQDELERYGFQSALTAREIYRGGLQALDAYANALFGSDFIDLDEAQQDQIVGNLADTDSSTGVGSAEEDSQPGTSNGSRQGESSGESGAQSGDTGQTQQSEVSKFFHEPSATDFFEMLRDHTIEGMFCDPVYGGNQDMVGWKLINYPGAQRAYTVTDMRTEAIDREPQSLAQLGHFHPGQPSATLSIIPVSGLTEQDQVVDVEENYPQRLFDEE